MVLQTAAAKLEEAQRGRPVPNAQSGAGDVEGGPRVLLIEPVPSVRRALADLLRLRLDGTVVCETALPASALTMITEWCPSVLVTDSRGVVDQGDIQGFVAAMHEVDQALPVLVVFAAFGAEAFPADCEFGAYQALPKGDVEVLVASITEAHLAYQAVRRQHGEAEFLDWMPHSFKEGAKETDEQQPAD